MIGVGLVIGVLASFLLMAAVRTARDERLAAQGLVEVPYLDSASDSPTQDSPAQKAHSHAGAPGDQSGSTGGGH